MKRAVQIGIISRGQKCARINRPGHSSLLTSLNISDLTVSGIYTKVSAFKKWIRHNAQEGGKVHFV